MKKFKSVIIVTVMLLVSLCANAQNGEKRKASREQMIGATLYLVGKEMSNGEYVQNTSSCAMCKRMVINAGIDKVIVRNNKTDFTEIDVNDWIMSDDSLDALRGY